MPGVCTVFTFYPILTVNEPRPAKTCTCVLDINHQNVTSKFGTRSELAFEDSFSIEWVSLLSKEFQVSSNVSGQLILALGESSSHGG